ncbi:MAG: right-handed parallel beta-helix repeat-containing protein [Candidatus Bathyarchaeia archaeon]
MKNQVFLVLAVIIVLTASFVNLGNSSPQALVTIQSSGIVQQTSTETYSYIISVSGSNYQMTKRNTGQIDYRSTNATRVINYAIGNLTQGGGGILFCSGTYDLNGSITGTNEDNITLSFAQGALLYVENNMNCPAILITNCNNWQILGAQINGNAANQALQWNDGSPYSDGVLICGTNDEVSNAYIYNCRVYGACIGAGNNSGIIQSTALNCGWNGIQLGLQAFSTSIFDMPNEYIAGYADYAKNNNVAFCSDVGITNYGVGDIVTGNYVYDMNGTTGSVNSQLGIAVEGTGNDTITGNTISNCRFGICITTSAAEGNVISSNMIASCTIFGICTSTNNNNISENQLSKCYYGIGVSGSFNIISANNLASTQQYATNIVGSFNTIYANNFSSTQTWAIGITGNNNLISNNHATQWDIINGYNPAIQIAGNNNQIEDNALISTTQDSHGIYVSLGQSNQISGNSISCPQAAIRDSGTSTIISTLQLTPQT